MSLSANPRGQQAQQSQQTAGGEKRQDAQRRHRIEGPLWLGGVIVFTIFCIVIHLHKEPYPFDIAITQTIQNLHLWPWVNFLLVLPSKVNDPIPSMVALGFWLGGFLTMACLSWRRGKSPVIWLQVAVFLILGVAASAGTNVLIASLVGRPRPDPQVYPIQLYREMVPFPSFPSGHVEHDVVYYGFLFYLSLTRSVREWRYRGFLLPLQLYVIYDFITIGYSRILEGAHWATDILGGYLEGVLLLFALIFLYRLTTDWLARRKRGQTAVSHA